MEWFYAKNNQQLGPVTLDVLTAMFHRGELQPTDLVWRDGMPNWIPASSTPELASAVSGPASPIGYYNPVAAGAMGGQPIYAGFWLRWVAAIIDGLLLGVVGFILNFVIRLQHPIINNPGRAPQFFFLEFFTLPALLGWVIAWLYHSLMESSPTQGSLGKMALGLIVTDMAGQRITFARASGRFWGKFLSEMTLFIGYMMAGWTERKQALHDILASCLVIRRP
jgi:uncharacterized RDD family membrane protein YckC